MKIEVSRYWIDISPECAADVAYIEEVLGLKGEMDTVKVTRQTAFRSNYLLGIRVQKVKPQPDTTHD